MTYTIQALRGVYPNGGKTFVDYRVFDKDGRYTLPMSAPETSQWFERQGYGSDTAYELMSTALDNLYAREH